MLKLQDLPERPGGRNPTGSMSETFQLWSLSGETCPGGTIPIRRTNEEDMLRASSLRRFGRKIRRVRRDSSGNDHEVRIYKYPPEKKTKINSKLLGKLDLFFLFIFCFQFFKIVKESGQRKWQRRHGSCFSFLESPFSKDDQLV